MEPAYQRIYRRLTKPVCDLHLHSCGYIIDILDDLIGPV